jgi:hypothetical protein
LYDEDTDAGLRIDFTLDSSTSYTFTMTPLDHPELAYTQSDNLPSIGPIDWIEFVMYNTDSDFYPSMVATDARATDYYIRSIEIMDAAPPGLPGDFNEDGTVDAADYVMWRKTDGLQSGYTTWREHFGEMNGGRSAGSDTVPEPATVPLLLIVVASGSTSRTGGPSSRWPRKNRRSPGLRNTR